MFWIKIGSLLMFLAVGLGAFGSHILKDRLSDHAMEIYKTAVFYHFIHALALFVIAWLLTTTHHPFAILAGLAFIFGIILFSGSLYVLSLTGIKWLGMLTPIGGLLFLLGWGLLIFL